MVLRTPLLNLPYVQPTDTVTSYPTTSQELATTLDERGSYANLLMLAQSAALASGWNRLALTSVVTATSDITLSGGGAALTRAGKYLIVASVTTNPTPLSTTMIMQAGAGAVGNSNPLSTQIAASSAILAGQGLQFSGVFPFTAGNIVCIDLYCGTAGVVAYRAQLNIVRVA